MKFSNATWCCYNADLSFGCIIYCNEKDAWKVEGAYLNAIDDYYADENGEYDFSHYLEKRLDFEHEVEYAELNEDGTEPSVAWEFYIDMIAERFNFNEFRIYEL